MDHMEAIRATFYQECEEQLAALESGLLSMESGDDSLETVNAVFRAVHSIKGGAGAFKLTDLVSFSHTFETLLDLIRGGKQQADSETVKLLLRSADVLSDLVRMSRDGEPIDASFYAGLLSELNAAAHGPGLVEDDHHDDDDEYASLDFSPAMISIDEEIPPQTTYRISFIPHAELYRKANDPLALFRELERLGHLKVTANLSALPRLADFRWQDSYLSFKAELVTDKPEQAIREVFDFVEGDCDLVIEAQVANAATTPAVKLTLVPDTSPSASELEEPAVDASPANKDTTSKADDSARPVATAKSATAQQTIRVDLDRVDRLINLVGELVINQAMLAMRFGKSGVSTDTGVSSSLEELDSLTREIQDSVMAIRAQPVKSLFQRMSRIVREVADATGKEVRLKTEGELTEVDKTVVEQLADPLTHMIRNAVDHGLETPEARLAAGKPAEGSVRLSAAHRSGRVVITVADDGAGINRPRVLAKATEKGLVPAGASLTDSEIDNLLFLPGFSTVTEVSSISGRGVGMDVVKRSIQALGGRISIASVPRQGTTFSLSLPLTLAVLDGIIVSIAEQTYVIPLTAVVETLQPEAGLMLPMGQGTFAMRVRDSFVPLVDVGYELGIRPRMQSGTNAVAILVEIDGHSRCALLVDTIQDQRQVVIKSLEANYGGVRGVAAATILGDGRVAMILDVDSLVTSRERMHSRESQIAKAS